MTPSVFAAGRYRKIVVVGYLRQGEGGKSSADIAAANLVKFGCDAGTIIAVTVPFQSAHRFYTVRVPPFLSAASSVSFELTRRTYAGGEGVKKWLQQSGTSVCCLDVLTVGVHARKSWILVRHALGETYRVGIIAAPEPAFDRRYWLLSRRGLWMVGRNVSGSLLAQAWTFSRTHR